MTRQRAFLIVKTMREGLAKFCASFQVGDAPTLRMLRELQQLEAFLQNDHPWTEFSSPAYTDERLDDGKDLI